MGEPITLYDKDGNIFFVYGPATMHEALEAGATIEKPQPKAELKETPAKGKGK